MKVVLLAGGYGTRLGEETHLKPKPMVEVGDKPMLWHIMKMYSHYGFNEFIVCLGYKGYFIKEYFSNYFLHQSDVTFDLKNNKVEVHHSKAEPWKITLVDTGISTMTGGRMKKIKKYLDAGTFMMTYGDGVSDVNIKNLLKFHKTHKKLATITSVQPAGRFGSLALGAKDKVEAFIEKPRGDGAWINGGFFVVNPKAIEYIGDDVTNWEAHTLPKIVKDNQLAAYEHRGFWAAMDTLRDKVNLEAHWEKGSAPWKVWKE